MDIDYYNGADCSSYYVINSTCRDTWWPYCFSTTMATRLQLQSCSGTLNWAAWAMMVSSCLSLYQWCQQDSLRQPRLFAQDQD